MALGIDPAVWEDKLVSLLFRKDPKPKIGIPAVTGHIIASLANALAHDDEVELHPYDTRVFTVRIRERSDQPKALIEPNLIAGAIGDYCNVRPAYITVEEVK